MAIRSQKGRHLREGLVKMTAAGIQPGQFDRTASGVASYPAKVSRLRRQGKRFRFFQGVGKILGQIKLATQVRLPEQLQGRVNALTGDIFTGHAFAEPDRSIFQHASNHQIVRFGPRVGRMADRLFQANSHLVSCPFSHLHHVMAPILVLFFRPDSRSGVASGIIKNINSRNPYCGGHPDKLAYETTIDPDNPGWNNVRLMEVVHVMVALTIERPDLFAALSRKGVPVLKRVKIAESELQVILEGAVPSYYLKQLAQEAILPNLQGRDLINRIEVIRD